MVAVPVLPPTVAVGAVVFDPVTLIIAELSELQLAAALEVRVTLEPLGLVAKLIEFPLQLLQVIVMVCPTVTVAVPLKLLNVAVIVTGLVVFCTALTRPVLLRVTNVCVVSELSQTAEPVTSLVVPSLLVAMAVNCRVAPD